MTMKPENEMNEEVKQLLDCLKEHGKNVRRQKELSDLMDRLAEEEKTAELPRKHRKLTPIWWAMGAAAACLLLWLLVRPSEKQTPEMNEEILVEAMETVDSTEVKVKDIVIEEPIISEELLAEETPIAPKTPRTEPQKPRMEIINEVVEQPILAELTPTEPIDTSNIGSNTIPTVSETPSAVQKPQRRVIRSLNLVCYECQKAPEPESKIVLENKTLFGQPQDPNMKNGSLAFEIKLY